MATVTHTSKTVLGPDGLPFKSSLLMEEQATPTTTGVRSLRHEGIADGLDPIKLAALLKAANEGDNHDFLVLAEEMEERDGHYSAVLGQRKRAVSLIEPIVTAASDSSQDKEIADAVEDLIMAPIFADMVDDLLDGLSKGYSVVETMWDFGENRWTPKEYIFRDPRHFQFDELTGRELRIRDDDVKEGLQINPYTMLIHRPKLKSGLSMRGGLARVVVWCFMLKSYTLQDWAAFLEVFGMPLRVGKYDDTASAGEKRILLRAVRDLAADAAAIIPKSMEIEFIEVSGGQGNAVFGAMTEYLDKQVSKAVIGQTMTTDEGSSNSQSQTHDEVRDDIKKSDARQLGTTIKRDLIAPFVAINWGPDVKPPLVTFQVEDPEDIKALSETLAAVVPLGFRVAQSDVSKRMGFRVPDKDEAVLQMATTAPIETTPSNKTSGNAACPSCGEVHLASSQAGIEDFLVDEAMSHWEADMSPVVEGVLALARSANGFEDFLAKLDDLTPDVAALGKRLANQMMKAKGDGMLDG